MSPDEFFIFDDLKAAYGVTRAADVAIARALARELALDEPDPTRVVQLRSALPKAVAVGADGPEWIKRLADDDLRLLDALARCGEALEAEAAEPGEAASVERGEAYGQLWQAIQAHIATNPLRLRAEAAEHALERAHAQLRAMPHQAPEKPAGVDMNSAPLRR
jgi:hypothetical protein